MLGDRASLRRTSSKGMTDLHVIHPVRTLALTILGSLEDFTGFLGILIRLMTKRLVYGHRRRKYSPPILSISTLFYRLHESTEQTLRKDPPVQTEVIIHV